MTSEPTLIGSRALQVYTANFKVRPNSDYDFIGIDPPFEGKVEMHHPDHLLNTELVRRYRRDNTFIRDGVGYGCLNQVGQYVMKRSHLWRDQGFDKHILQFHLHLGKRIEGLLKLEDWDVLSRLTEATHKAYPQGNPNLNTSNEDFFDDAVDKKYDHDWIHELYAYESKPMYTRLKHDDTKAWCVKDLWDELKPLQKNQCVAEECYVIATERFLVPKDFEYPAKLAYLKALKKVCTTLTSGYFRDHAIDNYLDIIQMFDGVKIENVKRKLQ
jgi:hypothetical protein